MDTIKITKGNVVLEYSGSTDDLREIVRDFIQSDVKKSILIQSTKSTNISEPIPKELENEKNKFPSQDDLINYITSKPEFEHTGAELQEKFLGRRLDSRKDQKLYLSFYGIIDRAKNKIAKQYHGEWRITGYVALSVRTRIPIFKFIKSGQDTQSENIEELLK